ncbi:MAG TPA: hypothetical protein VNV25_22250 [Gemmatimonadaceae bacterium]|jgi:hypothetical protein|nr:hypothetical protein [Gemmatimonadaceae bacterium]
MADAAGLERGVKNPSDTLQEAETMLQHVREQVGFGPASREVLAEALGYRGISGTSGRKVAALSHYGLLERAGSGYRISDLGKQLLMPKEPSERGRALAVAARTPALYQRLWARYQGGPLPALLPNLLVREHGVNQRSADEVAKIFRETMQFAGLLRNGIMQDDAPDGHETASEPSARSQTQPVATWPDLQPRAGFVEEERLVAQSATDDRQQADSRRTQRYTVALDKAGRLAVIDLPLPLLHRDLQKILAWVDYMNTVVEDGDTSEPAGDAG